MRLILSNQPYLFLYTVFFCSPIKFAQFMSTRRGHKCYYFMEHVDYLIESKSKNVLFNKSELEIT
jgi:hypothetical protein